MPRYDVKQVDMVTSQQIRGPIKNWESLNVERFNIPLKIKANSQVPINLTLRNRTDRDEAVNFAYSRSYPYTELINWDMTTGEEWVFVLVEATSIMEISGVSD